MKDNGGTRARLRAIVTRQKISLDHLYGRGATWVAAENFPQPPKIPRWPHETSDPAKTEFEQPVDHPYPDEPAGPGHEYAVVETNDPAP